MIFLAISAVAGLFGLVVAALMIVTIIGVCRFRKAYRRFFERFRSLHILPAVREIARLYLSALNKFLGYDVGFKQTGGPEKTKLVGWYLEHLLLLYWVGATILVLSFRPADPLWQTSNSLLQAGAFIILLTVNVISDAISLLWTKRCIGLLVLRDTELKAKTVVWILAQDILVAVGLMFVVQLISNGLYAVQIGRNELFFTYMFNMSTAFKPYAPVDPEFSHIKFPGQLIITCTTYIPSILFYLLCLVIVALSPLARLAFWILYVLRLDNRATGCTQIGFIGSLLAVATFGAGCFALISGAPLVLGR
jgi:hypothetical protein